MAISNEILSSTLRVLAEREVDNLYKNVPFLNEVRNSGGVEVIDGGSKIDRALILAEHSSITQLSSGYEAVNLAVSDALKNASYEFCDFVAPIVITKKEELSNRGERAIISIVEARMKSVMGMLQREFEKQIVANSSTVLTELNTLNGAAGLAGGLNISGSGTGFLEADAFGSQGNTVGGLSKATYNTFNNQFKNSTAGGGSPTFSANAIADMTEMYIECQNNSPMGVPNLILSSPTAYKNYKQVLFANERYMPEDTLDGGKLALAFASAKMYVDPFLPVTNGPNSVSIYMLNTEFMKLVIDSDANFTVSDFEHISGYASRAAHIMCRCQLITDHLASHALIVNAET
tara:strand:+ start:206 stop:1246 length:1041 start_codon:yes stop_codon:yes gene_type:complete